jgi:polysaccharide pyruvyl transferase WcaK-like protein
MPRPHQRSLVVLADTGGAAFHVGDEAMLAANLGRLDGLELRVLGRHADRAAIAAALDGADAALCSGGGNLSSSWPELLAQRVELLEAARARTLPVVVTGQTIGPDLDDDQRTALAGALRAVSLVGVRELPSAALAVALGVPADRVVLQVDDAFDLPAEAPEDPELLTAAQRPYLAVTLDGSFAGRALRRIAGQLADFAHANQLAVLFLPHEGPLGAAGDLDGAAGRGLLEVCAARDVPGTLVGVLEPAQVAWLTQQAAFVVSSRYHPIVFATAGAVPCVGLYRDRYTRIKLEGALTHCGLADRALSVNEAERGRLAGALRDVWVARATLAPALAARRPGLDAEEARRWAHVLDALGFAHAPDERQDASWPAAPLARAALAALPPTRDPTTAIAAGRWDAFARDGFMPLGQVLSIVEVEALCRRADEYAQGTLVNDRVQMQRDTGGDYDALPEAVGGFEQGTHLYRKIQGLEADELFSALVEHPVCLEVCARMYGPRSPISIFRAMIMNKPARQGTVLPWHQDGGDVWKLDRDPLVTIWVALDPATTANGCLEVVPGSHLLGLLTDEGSTLSLEDAERHCPPERRLPLEVEPGHAVVLHNWLIHRSGVNPSPITRRAFTTCYLDGRTRSTLTGDFFPFIAGSRPPAPQLYLEEMQRDRVALRESFADAEEYAHSLEAELGRVQDHAEAQAQALAEAQARVAGGAGLVGWVQSRVARRGGR